MEHLLLMLGTGPSSPEQVKKREYRQATYFLRDDPERGEETTPFVGEAILRLHPERFGRVHLFGTTASMWETLYWHALPGDASDEHVQRFDALVEAVGTDRLAQQQDLLRWVEQRFPGAHRHRDGLSPPAARPVGGRVLGDAPGDG